MRTWRVGTFSMGAALLFSWSFSFILSITWFRNNESIHYLVACNLSGSRD